ncbi:hypothetical protein P3T27_000840 [Kitasatospora sp. MAA19]|uniref:hypothetical protein n=1 Tax=Kitasatospora sp. MAA19 TaxID=3035090 RepID=UPI0024766866|nr:hypothetical protein [Kitasatospora sp. MAA19]MDH6704139.1 hypothetical protein [Kitasatospora sp. MAA19]
MFKAIHLADRIHPPRAALAPRVPRRAPRRRPLRRHRRTPPRRALRQRRPAHRRPRPGAEADTGELLEALGVFDIPKTPDDRDLAIVDLFLTAIDALGGIRAGHQHGLTRWFTTGNLTAAYLSLAATHPHPTTGNPTHYWTTLITAGELLATAPSPDPRIKSALTHCRTQAATHSPHP